MVDEELRQRRELEMAVGGSSSVPVIDDRSTTDSTEVIVGTTGPTHILIVLRLYAPYICFTYHTIILILLHWGQPQVFFRGGVNKK